MIELTEWITEGISIDRRTGGYRVFTIPTQHFDIIELTELTPERFKAEVEKQKRSDEYQTELFADLFETESLIREGINK